MGFRFQERRNPPHIISTSAIGSGRTRLLHRFHAGAQGGLRQHRGTARRPQGVSREGSAGAPSEVQDACAPHEARDGRQEGLQRLYVRIVDQLGVVVQGQRLEGHRLTVEFRGRRQSSRDMNGMLDHKRAPGCRRILERAKGVTRRRSHLIKVRRDAARPCGLVGHAIVRTTGARNLPDRIRVLRIRSCRDRKDSR